MGSFMGGSYWVCGGDCAPAPRGLLAFKVAAARIVRLRRPNSFQQNALMNTALAHRKIHFHRMNKGAVVPQQDIADAPGVLSDDLRTQGAA